MHLGHTWVCLAAESYVFKNDQKEHFALQGHFKLTLSCKLSCLFEPLCEYSRPLPGVYTAGGHSLLVNSLSATPKSQIGNTLVVYYATLLPETRVMCITHRFLSC